LTGLGFGEDFVGGLGPDEELAGIGPAVDEELDGGSEFLDAGEVAAAEGLACDDAEEDLDQVHLGPRGRMKCMVILGFRSNQTLTLGCLWVT
jgi:hypothetical protein